MQSSPRERWGSRPAFIMAAVGSAVGLGNLWRFPAQAFRHGGGAFFIPYFIALISAGIPLMIVEYAIGQKFQGSAPKALAAVTRKFRWVGWLALLVGTTIVLYYVVIMAYAWHYAVASFNVAWTRPVPKYAMEPQDDGTVKVQAIPAERIQLYLLARTPQEKERLLEIQARKGAQKPAANAERLLVLDEDELRGRTQAEELRPPGERVHYVSLDENIGNYFRETCLGGFRYTLWAGEVGERSHGLSEKLREGGEGGSDAPDIDRAAIESQIENLKASKRPFVREMFRISPNLVIGALVTWLLIFLIIFKGVRNVGRVVMVTVPLPVILLAVLLVRGLTLPGSTTGLIYYLKPNWDMLKEPSVWMAAYGQIFFSLSLGFGILIAYASYMPPESDVTNSAFITSFANCATSFFAGLAVFSVLGYLSYLHDKPVSEVVAGGPGLVFVTYPMALAKMPMATWAIALLSFLFFACLISLGIDSAFSIVEGMVAGFRDRFPHLSKPRAAALFCAVGFVGSLFFTTRSGLMWLDIVDNWMGNYGLALVGLLECIAVGYFFHLDELKDYINRHSEIKVHYWFDAFVKFVTPAVLIFLLGSQFLKNITETYGGYDKVLTHAVTVAGWGVFLMVFLLALWLGRSWKALLWALSSLLVFALVLAYLSATSDRSAAELVGPAAMGALGAVLLFGGLITCIHIAVKSGHPAGLSLEAAPPPKSEEDKD